MVSSDNITLVLVIIKNMKGYIVSAGYSAGNQPASSERMKKKKVKVIKETNKI